MNLFPCVTSVFLFHFFFVLGKVVIMDNADWKKTLHYNVKSIAYSLNFHSMAHHISANHYEEVDRRITYLEAVATTLSSACAGSLMTSFMDNSKNTRMKMFASALTLTAATTSSLIANLNSTEHSPAKKQARHKRGADRKRELCKKIDAWCNAALNPHASDDDLQHLETYNKFIAEQRKIDEECLRTEDWTFSQVHDQLAPQWKELGKRLEKFVPDKTTNGKGSFLTMEWVVMFGTLVTVVALWKIVDHCIHEN